jgi:hypothetical protein
MKLLNVDLPNSIIDLKIKQPTFEWYVVKCDSKNRYQEDMYLKDIGLHAQKHDNYSRFSNPQIWEHRYDPFVSMRIFTLIMDKKFMQAPKNYEDSIRSC